MGPGFRPEELSKDLRQRRFYCAGIATFEMMFEKSLSALLELTAVVA